MQPVNLEGLTEEQLRLVERFANLLRGSREGARAELQRMWQEWAASVPSIPEAEVEALVEEAVARARGRV
jgi:hypothetical protein